MPVACLAFQGGADFDRSSPQPIAEMGQEPMCLAKE
jgi:hypothetical protein